MMTLIGNWECVCSYAYVLLMEYGYIPFWVKGAIQPKIERSVLTPGVSDYAPKSI
jgi:hypothetical protein